MKAANLRVWGRLLQGHNWSFDFWYFDVDGMDLSGQPISPGRHTSWDQYKANPHTVPDRATRVEIRISCFAEDATPCGAFDDIFFAMG